MKQVIITAFAVLSSIASANAAAVTDFSSGPEGTFTVSSTDLANDGQSTFSAFNLDSGTADFGSSLTTLTDGDIYGGGFPVQSDQSFLPSNGAQATLIFDTSINTLGYDLTDVIVLTGSAQGRSGQSFSVSWAAPGSGSYTLLYSVTAGDGSDIEGRTHHHDAGNTIATGVGSLRFTFSHANGEGSMFREVDVVGSASAIPEPASFCAIAGLAVLGLTSTRRRQRG